MYHRPLNANGVYRLIAHRPRWQQASRARFKRQQPAARAAWRRASWLCHAEIALYIISSARL